MSFDLDHVDSYTTVDPEGMVDRIQELPIQMYYAWEIAREAPLPKEYKRVRHVILTGMGAAAIGAELLAGLMAGAGKIPVEVVRGYELPAHVWGEDVLVVGCSKSGETEETLAVFNQARERGARLLAITAGGALAAVARELKAPTWRFVYHAQSRTALGFFFTLMLGLACRLNLYPDAHDDVQTTARLLVQTQRALVPDTPTDQNPAKQLALALQGTLPAILGAGFLSPVAQRWQQQFNESAKQWALWGTLPEFNHNQVAGLTQPEGVRECLSTVCLRSDMDHYRVKAQWDITQALLKRDEIKVHDVRAQGTTLLDHMATLVQLGDFVSYYSALLNGVDPTPVENIDYLKQQMAEVPE